MNPLSPPFSPYSLFGAAEALATDMASLELNMDSSRAFHVSLDALQEAVLLLEKECIAYANPAALSLFSAEAQSMVGKKLSDWLICKEYSELHHRLHSSREGSIRQHGKLKHSQSQMIRVDLQLFSIGSMPGKYILFLRESEQNFTDADGERNAHTSTDINAAIESGAGDSDCIHLGRLPCGVMRVDRHLRYLYGNPAMMRYAPFLSSTDIGCKIENLRWPPAFCASLQTAVSSLMDDPRIQRVRLRCSDRKGEPEWWADAIPECNDKEQLLTVTFLSSGMPSDDRQQETVRTRSQLLIERQRREEAVAASQARDMFFGWVSHELRTPMNGIQSWAHILETYVNASSASALAQRALQGIRHGIAQQVQLMDELLDVGRIIEGRLTLSPQAFVLRPTMQAAMESVQPSALSRHIDLDCQYSLARERVRADPCRVEQMMRLLLTYLLGRSHSGSTIHLHAYREEERIHVLVHSTCNASPPSREVHAESVSRSFRKEKWCRQELDIFLTRRLAELQGGLLECEYGGGEVLPCFTLVLPLYISGRRRATAV